MKYISHRAIILKFDTVDHYYHRFVHLSEKPDVPEHITAPVRKGDIENLFWRQAVLMQLNG